MELNGNESSRSETVDCAPCPNDRSQNQLPGTAGPCFQAWTTIKPFKVTSCLMKPRHEWEFASPMVPVCFEVLNPQSSQNRIIQHLYFMNGFVIQWQMFCLQWYARCIKSLLHGVKFLPVLVCDNRFSSNFRILVTAFWRIWRSTRSDKNIHRKQQLGYPLVNVYIAMERSTIFNGTIHYKWPFSIAMLVHQRVYWAWLCAWCACPILSTLLTFSGPSESEAMATVQHLAETSQCVAVPFKSGENWWDCLVGLTTMIYA